MTDVVLITGCSRGIGLGLARAFAESGHRVVATCRDPSKATELASLLEVTGQAPALALDTTDPANLIRVTNILWAKYGQIDILINNAGVATKNHPHDPPEFLDVKEMSHVYTTNVGGTCATTQAFLPLLRKAPTPRVLAISSFLGSISRNLPSETNFYMATSYRCSKAALNQLIRCLALDIPEVTFLSVSPGHVQTDMGNSAGRSAPLSVEMVAVKIKELAISLTPAMTGGFRDYEGKEIPF